MRVAHASSRVHGSLAGTERPLQGHGRLEQHHAKERSIRSSVSCCHPKRAKCRDASSCRGSRHAAAVGPVHVSASRVRGRTGSRHGGNVRVKLCQASGFTTHACSSALFLARSLTGFRKKPAHFIGHPHSFVSAKAKPVKSHIRTM